MDVRELRYFLAIAQDGNITAAASRLHVTQPTLSRQIRDLENELGEPLFVRHSHSVSLTEAGSFLYDRAQDIVSLVDETTDEFRSLKDEIGGDIYIGAAETREMRLVARAVRLLREDYPNVSAHITSGNAADLCPRLDNGTLDFALLSQPSNLSRYDHIDLPTPNSWMLYVRKDSPLASKNVISPQDLVGVPLIVSSQSMRAIADNNFVDWFGEYALDLTIAADFNLAFNGAMLVQEGVGTMITWNGIVDISADTGLVALPLDPPVTSRLFLAWRKNTALSKAAGKFFEYFRDVVGEELHE